MAEIKYGTPSSSEEMNTLIESFYSQINEIVAINNETAAIINEQNTVQNVQNEFSKRRIIKLEEELAAYKTIAENADKFNKTLTVPVTDMIPYSNAVVDTQFGLGYILEDEIIPISYISTSAGPFIPADLEIQVKDGIDKQFYVETERKNIINHKETSIWHREYHFTKNSTISEVTAEVIIDMPYQNISNYLYNFIKVRPYPFRFTDVLSVETYDGTSWTKVKDVQLESKNILIHTAKSYIKKLKIKLRQRTSLIINNEKIFYLGLEDVFVGQMKTSKESATFYFDIDTSESMMINEIIPVFLSGNTDAKMYEYEVCEVSDTGFLTILPNKFPISVEADKKIRIFVSIHQLDSLPFLKNVTIKHSYDV